MQQVIYHLDKYGEQLESATGALGEKINKNFIFFKFLSGKEGCFSTEVALCKLCVKPIQGISGEGLLGLERRNPHESIYRCRNCAPMVCKKKYLSYLSTMTTFRLEAVLRSSSPFQGNKYL
jgi:hypothetical protein